MTQLGSDQQGLVFEIASARIEDADKEKKHVIYTLQVRHISGHDDLSPSVIDRRYTHFLNLYNALKQEKSRLMTAITFPKKVILGNFNNEVISARSFGFEALLKHIATESQLRSSRAVIDFLQNIELEEAKVFLKKEDYESAQPILENSFKLLNKVCTDRSTAVLLALCRLLACTIKVPSLNNALKWAELALHRYDGVSDSDLLALYIPLLHACITVYKQNNKDTTVLEVRIKDLAKRGIRSDTNLDLMAQVNLVEEKILRS